MAPKENGRFHVVYHGRRPGVYRTWIECNKQVAGFSNNVHTSYATLSEAEAAWNSYCDQHHVQDSGGLPSTETPPVEETSLCGNPGPEMVDEHQESNLLLTFSMEEWVGHACYMLGIQQPTYEVAETRVINGTKYMRYHAWLSNIINGASASSTGRFASTPTLGREDAASMLLTRMVDITGMEIKDFNHEKIKHFNEQVAELEAKINELETKNNFLTTKVGELNIRLKYN